MKKISFKMTNGVRKMCTKEEIKMVLYFESKGLRVNDIETEENGVVVVLFSDGVKRRYEPFEIK